MWCLLMCWCNNASLVKNMTDLTIYLWVFNLTMIQQWFPVSKWKTTSHPFQLLCTAIHTIITLLFSVKHIPQPEHLYLFIPSQMVTCPLYVLNLWNTWLHFLHFNDVLQILKWSLCSFTLPNSFLHIKHCLSLISPVSALPFFSHFSEQDVLA